MSDSVSMPAVQTAQEEMRSAGKECLSKGQDFTGYLRDVNGQMATLQGSWTGDASNRFNEAMDNWENSFKNIITQLFNLAETLGQNADAYRGAEDDAGNVAQSFMSALPGI